MEYNSFYGGRRGASFIIVKSFKTEQEMAEAFSQGGQYKAVNYDEYVIIDTENKNDINNGKIYRRGYNYANDPNGLGGAEYIGQIVGPAGLGPHAEVIEKNEVNKKYQEALSTGDQLDYRHGIGTLDTETNDLVPGAKGEINNRTFDDTTDKIHWEYFSLRDNKQLESTCYIGFQVPYTVFDFFTKAVNPYDENGRYADMTAITRQAISDEHPFYEQWEISIPKGVKGDMLNNFRLYTPIKDETLSDFGGVEHTLSAGRTVLIYDYWTYDNKIEGEKVTLYLGEYEVIDDILIDNDGTVTIKYKSNREDTVFNKRIQWIDSITLTEEGVFTVNYNNGIAPYTTNLVWIKDLALAHDGTITLTYNNNETQIFKERINWIDNISMNDYGLVTVTYNNEETKELEKKIKWINQVELASNGELKATFNDGQGPQYLNTLKWLSGSKYDAQNGILTFYYNTGATEQYEYKYIGDVSLTDVGTFTVKDNTGTILLEKVIEYPTIVELVDGHILKFTANTGNILLEQDLQWVENLTVAEDGTIILTYNNGTTQNLENKIKWIVSTNTDENGIISIIWNDGTTTKATSAVKWINELNLSDSGQFTVVYNDGKEPQTLNTIKWLTNSTYDNTNGTLTFAYNTGDKETYEYKYISNVTLSDVGNFIITDNTNTEILNTTIEYPTQVELLNNSTLKITANTGNVLLEQNLQWVEDISIEDDRFKLTYNNGNTKILNEVLLNQIEKMSIPMSGIYMYHLLVYYSAEEARGNITWDNITGWIDLGTIKDYNGILVGTNIDSTSNPDLDDYSNALNYLNTTYPNGITEGLTSGKVVTIGTPESRKKFYAYDYQNNEWIYLGDIDGMADIHSVIAGPEDESTEQQALALPTGSLWFVIEGDE